MATIFIVEDNDMNLDMLMRRLEKKGYGVVFSQDGLEALARIAAEKPDLILMDMSLPGMDGWEATGCLKANPELAHIPVIGLSAHAMAGDREKAMDAGCDDYEVKPLDFTKLVKKIETLLAARRSQGLT